VEIDGTSIEDVDGAIAKVKDLDPGATVKMVVVREGKREVLTAVLGDRADMAAKLESKDFEVTAKDDDEDEYYNFRIPRVKRFFKDINLGQGGYIGVEIRDISADLGSYFGVGCCEGVLVLGVVEDSPAATAGLKDGDVIIKVDGEDVGHSGEFAAYVRDHEPGDKLDITFLRSKETRRVTVEVGENDCSRIFLNQAGEPDVFGMCCKPGELQEKCIQLGDKCFMVGNECKAMGKEFGHCCKMRGEECAQKCKMMAGEGCKKDIKCDVKVMQCPGKAMEEHGKMMECQRMMQEGKPLPEKDMERIELQRPSPEQIRILRSTEGAEAELRAEIEQLKTQIEHLEQEMETLRKP
jgi:hypothetical protein